MRIRYCYLEQIGHLVKSTEPGKSLCGLFLLNSGLWRDKPLPGRRICEKCKAQRAKIKLAADSSQDQIRPDSKEFVENLSPEEKMAVLAARQAARERSRES